MSENAMLIPAGSCCRLQDDVKIYITSKLQHTQACSNLLPAGRGHMTPYKSLQRSTNNLQIFRRGFRDFSPTAGWPSKLILRFSPTAGWRSKLISSFHTLFTLYQDRRSRFFKTVVVAIRNLYSSETDSLRSSIPHTNYL